jgi:hypothetical protein
MKSRSNHPQNSFESRSNYRLAKKNSQRQWNFGSPPWARWRPWRPRAGLDRHAVGGDGVAVVEGDVQERVARRCGPLIARGLVGRAPVRRRAERRELCVRGLAA